MEEAAAGKAEEIAPILAEIFRQSLRDGVIPSIWKNADVAPVFKKGGMDTAENYRPISLTGSQNVLLVGSNARTPPPTAQTLRLDEGIRERTKYVPQL